MPAQFLIWIELMLVWAFVAYGLCHDPCHGEPRKRFWLTWLIVRSVMAAGATLWLSNSYSLSAAMFVIVFGQAQLRYRMARATPWTTVMPLACLLLAGVFIWRLQLQPAVNLGWLVTPEHLAAACSALASLLCVARGAGYFVEASLKAIGSPQVGLDTRKRGYTIGVLERLILSVVVAFGSFDALAFLIAAKGLIRAKEFEGEHVRHFTEYFIAGTLLSVLLAICAGLTIRFALIHLWPDLLTLKSLKAD